MSIIEIKKEFSRRELLLFGPLFALFCGLLGYFVLMRFLPLVTVYVLWAVAGLLILVYYLVPGWQRGIYVGWMYAIMPVGWVISHILLSLIYYLLLTPIGFVMRLVGYDPMHRKLDPQADTYWVERQPVTDTKRYFRQF